MRSLHKITEKINPTALNIAANLISFVVTFGISFFVTPYVTENVGMEAYGMISLAQNFTSYVTIITAALNSVASRFIIIEIHKKNQEEANKYFNSALFANTIFAFVIMLGSIFLIPNLENVINISPNLIYDTKATFAIVFLSFCLSLMFSVFGMTYYAENKLYVGAFQTIVSDCIRALLLALTFRFIGVKIQYVVAITLLTTLYANIYSICFTRKKLPDIRVSYKFAELKKVWTMIKAGIWNSLGRLSQILLNGLDLIITNLFIGGDILGLVSVAKTFSNILISIIASVSDTFFPKFLRAYSEGEGKLEQEFFASTKVLGFFSFTIITLFAAYCKDFFEIWLPDADSVMLQNLTFIGLLSILISGPIYSMFSFYTVINKIRAQALSTLVMSILSTATVYILLKTTNLGVYAIVGVSTFYGMIKNLTYNIWYLRRQVQLSAMKIYSVVLGNTLLVVLVTGVHLYFKKYLEITNFFDLSVIIIVSFVINSIIYFILRVGKEDKRLLLFKLVSVFKKE